MSNNFLKPTVIARTALGLLQREIVLPALVWRDAVADFDGVAGDTVSLRVPARTTARTRTLRSGGPLIMDELTETKVDVSLDTDVYNGIQVSDEELTLDIADFGAQVLAPQVRAVAEKIENAVADEMTGATYKTTISYSIGADPNASKAAYNAIVDARAALNAQNVSMSNRALVVGSSVEAALLKSDQLARVDASGSASALRDAEVGRIAGFSLYTSNAIAPNEAYAFDRTAFVLAMRAPVVPQGAPFGQSQSYQGMAMRWIRDYDPLYTRDRSIVSVYVGTGLVADGPGSAEVQTVTISGSPTGGTFTLSFKGNTTSAVAYNVSSANLRTALEGLPGVGPGNVGVSGSAGGPYTVTFSGISGDVPQMVASSSLTGGSSPSVAVATTTGGTNSLVRAVKLVQS